MKPVCSIVIRAFNEEKHIGRLLSGIAQQTIKDAQVILVDSGSSDRTAGIAAEHGAQVVTISPQDFTFGRSLNTGIRQAQSDLILIASAHVYPIYPDWIERMLAPFSDEKIALVYGKQRGISSSQFSEQQIFARWYPDESQPRQDHPFCNNANAAIRKALWQEHNYDESLPGLEDLEWAQWAFDQGYAVAYDAEAEIVHVHNESWQGVHKRYTREGMAFKQIYPSASFSLSDMLRLFLQNSGSDLGQAARQHVFFRQFGSILRFRWLQFHGTYIGYRRSGPLTWQLKQSFYYPRENGNKNGYSAQRDVKPISYD